MSGTPSGPTDPASPTDLAPLDADIASAHAAYLGALAAADHSPSAENLKVMDQQYDRRDWFLDKRARRMTRAELDAAYSRPMRHTVSA